MGTIKKLLSEDTLREAAYFQDNVRVENEPDGYHFHWRDLRIILDDDQLMSISGTVYYALREFGKGGKYHGQTIPNEIMLGDRIAIELMEDGNIHFHYRDVRLEISRTVFQELVGLFAEAAAALKEEDHGAGHDPTG